MWEGDHVELPALVVTPRAQRARKPWATLFIDGFSRLIMGWALSEALRPDNGLEFVATALARSCAALGVDLDQVGRVAGHRPGRSPRRPPATDRGHLGRA